MAAMENSMKSPQKKLKMSYSMILQFHSGYLPKENKTLIQKDICTPMLTTALFTIVKIQKQPKCPSTDEWINKEAIHTHTHTHTQ